MPTPRSRRTAWAVPLLCIVLTLAACSSSTAQDPGPAASGLEDGVLTVATTGAYRPMSFVADGQLQGYDVDWSNIFAEELGVEVEFVEGQLTGLLTGLQAGRYDVVMASLTITDERKQSIDFSDPYVADGVVATALQSNSEITDIKDLDGAVVGITSGSGYLPAIESIGGYAELREYPGSPEAFSDLTGGRIDTYAVGRIPASDYIKTQGDVADPIVLAGEPYELLPAAVGVKKGNGQLVEAINGVIEKKKADGTYDELCEKWFGFTIAD